MKILVLGFGYSIYKQGQKLGYLYQSLIDAEVQDAALLYSISLPNGDQRQLSEPPCSLGLLPRQICQYTQPKLSPLSG